jgi:DNA polymerase III delta subunit
MNTDTVIQIGTIIIALLGAVITYIVIPYIKSKTNIEQQNKIKFWVDFAVKAAEQIFNEPKMGEQKKQFVLEQLNKLGLKITQEELNILIEAVVFEINKNKNAVNKLGGEV